MRSPWTLAIWLGFALVFDANAQIRTDGTLGGPVTGLTGPNFLIDQALGRQVGANLFHSFQVFNVGSGESATFVTTSAGLANVISRVTGGTASQINGPIRLTSTNAAPNFYFINPAGVVFGQGATIDVPAGFHVSTANYIKFPDGNFYADPNVVSTLSSAAPEAFGFLGTTRAAITLKDEALLETKSPKGDQPISLIAGEVVIDNARVQTNGGEIRVAAVGSARQEVALRGPQANTFGDLQIANGALLHSTSSGEFDGGNILVSAGNAWIGNDTRGGGRLTGIVTEAIPESGGNAGNVTIAATGDLSLAGLGSIRSETFSTGQGGAIQVTADRIVMIQGGNVQSNAYASGAAGRVEVAARSLIIDGTQTDAVTGISSTNVRGSSGAAGDVDVSAAETMSLQSGGKIFSETNGYGQAGKVTVRARDLTIDSAGTTASTGIFAGAKDGTGAAGEIDVTVKGSLSIVDGGAAIASNTYTSGQAGGISVSAGALVIERKGSDEFTGISSNANSGTGNAGRIEVSVPGTLSILDGGQIQSSTFSSGNAGTVIVKAGTLVIDGASSGGYSTGISTSAEEGTGNAGNIDVTVQGTLSILNGGSLVSDTYTAGNAGNVTVKAGALVIDGKYLGDNDFTGISSDSFGSGNGGSVDVAVDGTLSIVNGGQISSDTYDSGRAGTVTVRAGTLVLDGTNSGDTFNGISSNVEDGTGAGGNVNVDVSGVLSIVGGAEISSNTFSAGPAGSVTVKAGTLVIDGINSGDTFNGISSEAVEGTGAAGNVNVAVSGALTIVNTGQISSNTNTSGHAGSVVVTARDIHIEASTSDFTTGISSNAASGSTGNAGSVTVNATQTLSVLDRGLISSDTYGAGHAGSVMVTARDIGIEGSSSGFTGISSDANSGSAGNAGSVTVNATETLSIANHGQISSNTFAAGNAGSVAVAARNIGIDGRMSDFSSGIISNAYAGSGNAGSVSVTAAETLTIVNHGEISSNTSTAGRAGSVMVKAGDLRIEGDASGLATTISSLAARGSSGDAGSVDVAVSGSLSILNAGEISTDTFSSGNAGSVAVAARSIAIDGKTNNFTTGITSIAYEGTGNAGSVNVAATEKLAIVNHGEISSSTSTAGRAGSVIVKAGDLRIEGDTSGFVTGILSRANSGSTGDAGSVDVRTADLLSLASAGVISSSTFGSGNAGGLTVAARNILIDGQGNTDSAGLFSAASGGSGNAGSVSVAATDTLTIVNHGEVSSSTTTDGRAGTVTVNAGNITIQGDRSGSFTGIRSVAEAGSSGDAGSVDISVVGRLSFANPSAGISSGTAAAGRAGSVDVKAGTIVGDNGGIIGAAADPGSSGQTGTVAIEASEGITLTNGASFSIRNDATLANPGAITPSLLTVTAPNMSLTNGGQITAASSGNVAASDVQVNFGEQLTVNNASIATSANDGNGGSIAVNGAGSLVLQNGQITTSVAGTQGNGGDIGITTPILVMQTGFIQANTAAKNASGGNVDIHVGTLLPSGGTLFVGGSTPYTFTPDVFGFNVIQAAAPTGVSGTIAISTPVLDITGSLSALPAKLLDSGGLARSPCAIVGGSSLSEVGRGGLPRGAGDLLWIDSLLDPSATSNTESTSLWTWGSPHPSAVPDSRSRTAPCAS